jgi:hypothetical protein
MKIIRLQSRIRYVTKEGSFWKAWERIPVFENGKFSSSDEENIGFALEPKILSLPRTKNEIALFRIISSTYEEIECQ